jgi:hypothetical protein
MKITYPKAYDALITHSNRYKILFEKLNDNTQQAVDTQEITIENALERIEIMGDMNETLANMIGDYESIVKELEQNRNIHNTALRAYAHLYGSRILLPEHYIDFGTTFNLNVGVLPEPGRTIIEVHIEEEDDNKYYRRRTYYQKIKDWLTLFRHIFREPQR